MVAMTRLLLPFTHGIDVSAITSALALAEQLGATLVVLSLIRLPQPQTRGVRLGEIEQSNDFLEFVQHKAARWGVPLVRVELYTHTPVSSIRALAQEMECVGIIVFVRRGSGVLLATEEVKQLLEDRRLPLYVAQLPAKKRPFSLLRGWLSRWLRGSTDLPADR
jgi:hypothetical protein